MRNDNIIGGNVTEAYSIVGIAKAAMKLRAQR